MALTQTLNVVFNVAMRANQADADIIARLGGPAKVAELLQIDKRGGVQRVQNWLTRGIPSAVKVKHPALFMPELTPQPAQQGVPHA